VTERGQADALHHASCATRPHARQRRAMLAQPTRHRNAGTLTPRAAVAMLQTMRLSDRKIDALADKIVRWLEQNKDIECLGSSDAIRAAIIDEFRQEKELERQLDEAVDRVMAQNETRMRLEGIDVWVMRKKIRQQLARERGIVL